MTAVHLAAPTPLIIDPSALIVALTGTLSVVLTYLGGRRGRKEEGKQKAVAQAVEDDKNKLDETQQALNALGELNDRLERRVRERDERIDVVQAERDAERDKRVEDLRAQRASHRAEFDEQEARCRASSDRLLDIAQTARSVLVDEISRAALGEQLQAVRPHPHDVPTTLPAPPARSEIESVVDDDAAGG